MPATPPFPRRTWLAIPAVGLFATDAALTAIGQTAGYWSGQYHLVVEGNPIAKPILAISPWLFLGLSFVWACLVATLIVFWNHRISNVIALLIAFGHSLGAASWILDGPLGWPGAIVFLFAASEFASRCWRRSDSNPLRA